MGHSNIFLSGPSHAIMWSGSPESLVDLHPAGFDSSYAMGAGGGRQVGFREVWQPQVRSFATMWSGSAASWVDLHPSQYLQSRAYDVEGDQQVGAGAYANATSATHALLWNGTAASAVNLNPATYDYSQAYATDGVQQVGYVGRWAQSGWRIALWQGSPESFVDLTPSGIDTVEVFGVGGGKQVGYGGFSGGAHALMWNSSSVYVDLNPGPGWGSVARATNGTRQVGYAGGNATNFAQHAAAWSGSAQSFEDFHLLLPSQFHGEGEYSWANGVDEFGNVSGWAWDIQRGGYSAILWRPVPEPSPATMLATGLLLMYTRFGRKTIKNRIHDD